MIYATLSDINEFLRSIRVLSIENIVLKKNVFQKNNKSL